MSLKLYQEKRDFKKTHEPKGRQRQKNKRNTLCFVIQKHAASHLHYDLRLEINGVLTSWAVPKGPPLIANEKRLALQVENHPYEYKDFEGIIPAGNYGAGKVIIWDEGYYEPADNSIHVAENYFSDALAAGHITFILHGKKLSGEFALIKIKRDPKNSWLFIRTQNNPAKKIKLSENSVRSGLTLEQMDALHYSSYAGHFDLSTTPKIPMPTSINPMLSTAITRPFNRKGWLFEIKWDGYRITALVNRQRVKLYTRNHQDYSRSFASVTTTLATLGLKAVFDGEMVVIDDTGRSQFQLMQQYQTDSVGQLIYYIFDVLWFNGHDLRQVPLSQRKQLLAEIVPNLDQVRISEHIEQTGTQFFKAAKALHLEGIMAKDATSFYVEGKRTQNWLKIKTRPRQEAVICGYTAPRGSRKLLGALILGVYDRGHLYYIGSTGTGFTDTSLKTLKARLDRLIQTQSPFHEIPKTKTAVIWVRPQLVCEVSFHEWTQDGNLRQAAFLGLREDKLARSVHREKPTAVHKLMQKEPIQPPAHKRRTTKE